MFFSACLTAVDLTPIPVIFKKGSNMSILWVDCGMWLSRWELPENRAVKETCFVLTKKNV